ncbi:MAG TPA: HAMP domain-containing protein [Minicystis sp.]|nr:HAMP domain-containing protein [Minicystis sp.]
MSEPSRPSITPPHAQRSFRHYLLNPRFQLKYTAYLVVVVLAVMIGLGVVIFRIAGASSGDAQFAAEQAEKALKESQTSAHVLQMQSIAAAGEDSGLSKMLEEELAKKDKEYEQNLAEVQRRKGEIVAAQQRLFYFLVGSAALLLLLLVVMGIFITHRIVGPVFKLKRLLRQVATGKLVIKERLRKGDELGDLFETFLQMTLSLKVLQLDRIATIDAAIEAAEKGQVPPEVLEKLRAVRGQMRLW